MKNTFSALFTFLWLSLFSVNAQYNTQLSGVTIFEHMSFLGKSQTLGVGKYSANQLVFGESELSSVRVPQGYRVVMYEFEDFTGMNLILTSDEAYVGDNFNDEASAIIVEKINSPNTPPNLSKNQIIIYEHMNFEGKSQLLELDSYDAFDLSIGNDALSSLRIPSGIKVTLYEHDDLEGSTLELTADTKYVGDFFNDRTSSIRVEKYSIAPPTNTSTTSTSTHHTSTSTTSPSTASTTPTLSKTIFVGIPTGQEDVPADNAAYEQEVLRLTNIERAKKRLPPLTWDKDLARAARYHAADMFTDGYFDHNTHDKVNGREVLICRTFERIGKFGKGSAENIAINYSPEDTVRAWVKSPGHYRNMMGSYKKIGIGYYKNHWVQVFGF